MPVITRTEWLDIDGTPLATPAWEVAAGGLLPLLQGPDVEGDDRRLPGGGVRRYKRYPTLTRRAIPMVIFTDRDLDGLAHASPAAGRKANIDYLRANVSDPTGIGDGTRTATLHLADLTTRTAQVHVEGLELGGDEENAILAVLTLSWHGAFA